ncbi:MAG: UDP-N-acetylmuramate dehydrogenase [Clostridia bacterium]|nr:UDP-N-acetylmuramate dehydrogenase [Clostridia bacterium]
MNGFDIGSGYENYEAKKPFTFADHSSIGCGGYARAAFYPKTTEGLSALIGKLEADKVPFYVVGNMTNVLPPDGESRRVFVCMNKLKDIRTKDGVYVSAGVTAGELLHKCKALSKTGAEFLEGIPCTLGGALYMNAGVKGAYIGDITESVTVLKKGRLRVIKRKDCTFSYKHSAFMDDETVIVGANLRLENADKEKIGKKLEEYRARRAHLPKGRSMGCVFKNPEGLFAGELIEGTGLKGFRVGGAKVSETHGNFIINDRGATSAQVRTLIGIVKNAVFAQYKIRLEEEIRILE